MSRPVLAAAIASALACTLPAAAHAQGPVDETVATDLDRVVVSASTSRIPDSDAALPNTITIIDQEQLREQLAMTRDLSQVLANLIPAFAPSRQKMSSFGESLRGRQPLYMVDGVPQSTPLRDGSRDAHTIDPAMIERIEVIHGANALQGLGASGGIINIITKRAPRRDGETFHEVTLGASTALPREDDSAGYRGAYLFGTRQGAFDLVGGASYAEEGLFYDGEGDAIAVDPVQGDLMDARSQSLFAKAGWDMGEERRLQLSVNKYRLRGDGDYLNLPGDYEAGETATSIPGEPPLDPPQNNSTNVNLDYTDRDMAGGTFQAQVFWTDFAARYGSFAYEDFFDTGSTETWYDQTQINAEKEGGKFTWTRGYLFDLPLRVSLGLDLIRDTTDQRYVAADIGYVPPTTYQAISPLVQAQYELGPVMLSGGLRYERAELEVDDFVTIPRMGSQHVEGGNPSFSEVLPNFGAVWEVTRDLKLYASYAEGYSVADIGRVLRGIDEPNQSVEQLVDLTPVIADNREVGLDYDDGRWLVHLAAYWSDSEFGSRLAFDAATQSYLVKREATEIEGIEGNVALQLTGDARLGVAWATADGRYDSDQDNRLDSDLPGVNISPDRVTAFWEQEWSQGLATRLQASHARDREFEANGAPAGGFEGFTTVDLLANVDLPVGALALGIENVFDRQYITYFSQTTPANDDYVAGRGRVFSASWSHRF